MLRLLTTKVLGLKILTLKVLTLKVLTLEVLIFFLVLRLSSNSLAHGNTNLQSSHKVDKRENASSWLSKINNETEQLIKDKQAEARTIINEATQAQNQYCQVAQDIAQQGQKVAHSSLRSGEGQSNSLYPKLLVFVSFSIPLESLKALGSQVNSLGGKLVLRGLIQGSFKETIAKLKELQEQVMIDPTLFEAFDVQVVPTFILREGSSQSPHETDPYDRLQGNVSLHYALEQFASHGNNEAKALLQHLRSAL